MKTPFKYLASAFIALCLLGISPLGKAISMIPVPTFPRIIQTPPSPIEPEHVAGQILVQLRPDADLNRLLEETGLSRIDRIVELEVEILAVPEGKEAAYVQALSLRPDVVYAELDYVVYSKAIPNDPIYSSYQWHLPKIQAHRAWDLTKGSSTVVIAVLDTGVDAGHPDLKNKILSGYNAITGSTNSLDDEGHGTTVSGIAAASSNNGVGITGVSWDSMILPVKVLDSTGKGSTSNIAKGVAWADDRAKILNMSLGGPGYSTTLANAVKLASQKGCLVLAAMGNEFEEGNPIEYPAAYPEVMAIGATSEHDLRSAYSNTGAHISVVAPGGEIYDPSDGNVRQAIWSTYPVSQGSYIGIDGTSAATPVVAGLAALLWSFSPNSTASQIRQAIERSAVDLGATGKDDDTGYGRVDALTALMSLGQVPTDTTPPVASITAPASGATVHGFVSVLGSVSDDKQLRSYQVQYGSGSNPASWISIGAAQTQPVTQGTLATWQTASLSDGIYSLRVSATDASNNTATSARVTVTVNNAVTTLTVQPNATLARTGTSVGVTVTSSGSMQSAPSLTASGACVSTTTVTLSPAGANGWSGSYLVPAGTSDCAVTFSASGTDSAGKAAQSGSAALQIDRTAPVAQNQNIGTEIAQPVTILLSATDLSPVTYAIVESPSHGTLGAVNGNMVTYTPHPAYVGTDRFTFIASDGSLSSVPATVDLTVGSCGVQIKGDVTGEGVVDIGDAVYILRTAVDLEQPDPCARAKADVDRDGIVALGDAIRILRFIVVGEPLPE